jgi:hypothetical protein
MSDKYSLIFYAFSLTPFCNIILLKIKLHVLLSIVDIYENKRSRLYGFHSFFLPFKFPLLVNDRVKATVYLEKRNVLFVREMFQQGRVYYVMQHDTTVTKLLRLCTSTHLLLPRIPRYPSLAVSCRPKPQKHVFQLEIYMKKN